MASKPAARPKKASGTAKKTGGSAKSAARKGASTTKSRATRSNTSARSERTTTARPSSRASARSEGMFSLDKIHQVALQATNLDEAINFYRNVLGLRYITRLDPPGLAFFDMGGFRLLLSATASEATLYFRVVDINNAVKLLKKRGVDFLQPPAMIHRDETGELGKKGVEEWMAFFKDPSGNLLALTERR